MKGLKWLISFFSGFSINPNPWVSITRFLVLIFLIFIHFIPIVYQFKTVFLLVFASILSTAVFLTKLIIYCLNKVVNHSVEISENDDALSHNNQANGNEPPPDGVPKSLWKMRHRFSSPDDFDEKSFTDLMNKGFDMNAITKFFKTIKKPKNVEETPMVASQRHEGYINCCGKYHKLHFTRKDLNAIFPSNNSLIYLFLIWILGFIQLFCVLKYIEILIFPLKFWFSILSGFSLYSTLQPPEVDPYSTTKGDIMTGITRPFSISLLIGLHFLFSYFREVSPQSFFFEYISVTIPVQYLFEIGQTIVKYILIFFPFLLPFIIAHPFTLCTWTLEWIARYLFGLSGATGFFHALFQNIRSGIVVLIVGLVLRAKTNQLLLSLMIGISSFLLQLPLAITTLFTAKAWKNFLTIFGTSIITFIASYCAAIFSYFSADAIIITAFAYCAAVDIVWPTLTAHSHYVFFRMRVVSSTSKTMNTLRLLTPHLFAPIVLAAVFAGDTTPAWYKAFVIVECLNKSMAEPHVFAIGLIVARITLLYELELPTMSLNLACGLAIAQKIVSINGAVDYFKRGRLSGVYLLYDTYYSDTLFDKLKDFLISFVSMVIPGPDRMFNVPAFVWSLFTGAPFNSPQNVSMFMAMSSPRPNCFWDYSERRTLDIARPFTAQLTEHPVEVPVYMSAARALCKWLSALVRSGKIGIVSANQFYLFLSEPLAAFVHVIALEPYCVRFQLRGLEYNEETICHLGEVAKIQSDLDQYRDRVPNFASELQYLGTDWRAKAKAVPLEMYNVTLISIDTAFVGLTSEAIGRWVSICFGVIASENSGALIVSDGEDGLEIDDDLAAASASFQEGVDLGKATICLKAFKRAVLENGFINAHALYNMYQSKFSFSGDDAVFNTDELMTGIFIPAARKVALILIMASIGLAPELNDVGECVAYIGEETKRTVSCPVTEEEFTYEFKKEKRNLFSMEIRGGLQAIFFRLSTVNWDVLEIERDFVRSFWASEAFSQMFLGEDDEERLAVQEDDHMLHNLILQACDLPIGYPAYVSPVLASYCYPPNSDIF